MTQQHYYYGLGRRKTSVAKVRLYPGTGAVVINGRSGDEVFTRPLYRQMIERPFRATDNVGKFNVQAVVHGGGISGWAGAISHGISRALVVAEETYRVPLRRFGLLSRDSRMKERKKYGLKRARKAQQYTKR